MNEVISNGGEHGLISIDQTLTADYRYTLSDFPNNLGELDRLYVEHRHSYYQIMILESGTATILCENSIVKAAAPFVVFYPVNVPHFHLNHQSQPYYRIHFSPEDLELLAADTPPFPAEFAVLELTGAEYEQLKPYVELLMNVPDTDHRQSQLRMLLSAGLFELAHLQSIHAPDEQADRNPPSTGTKELVYRICVYLNENYPQQFTLDELADRFFISRAKLVRIFHKVTGLTVGEYLKNARLTNARRCLRMGHTVQETAELCGFSSPSHFAHCFSAAVGCPPHKYAMIADTRNALLNKRYHKE